MARHFDVSLTFEHELEIDISSPDGSRKVYFYDEHALWRIEGNDIEGYKALLESWTETMRHKQITEYAELKCGHARGYALMYLTDAELEAQEARVLAAWMEANGISLVPDNISMRGL